MSSKKSVRPADRLATLSAKQTLKMARSAHAYVRGSTVQFYEWLEGAGAIYASQTLAFKAPVRIGDTVVATCTVAPARTKWPIPDDSTTNVVVATTNTAAPVVAPAPAPAPAPEAAAPAAPVVAETTTTTTVTKWHKTNIFFETKQ